MSKEMSKIKSTLSFEEFKKEVLNDYRLINESRQCSLLGRKEVLTGKAKFGIFGDGKELAQIALAKVFKNGDFRSGYYRDQTFMMAIGELTLPQYFAGLYAHTDEDFEPMSAGRQMGGHFATRSLDENGDWKNLMEQKNSSSDISPTASQMPRLLGLAYASHFYRINKELHSEKYSNFSNKGNEIAVGTIGDASTSEGLFWETVNAAGVLQIPMMICVWDDGHGISVPKKYQTTKESISEVLKGFKRDENGKGYEIFKTKGWDYSHLCETFENASRICREEHVPVLIHVEEVTQPQGHSTSGSHERYKSKERLQWEADYDCIKKMKEFILSNAIAKEEELNQIEEDAKIANREAKNSAWNAYLKPILEETTELKSLLQEMSANSSKNDELSSLLSALSGLKEPIRKDLLQTARKAIRLTAGENNTQRNNLLNWIRNSEKENFNRYSSQLHKPDSHNFFSNSTINPLYTEDKQCDGREILRDNFDKILGKYPETLIFGEDSGKIGGVNQGLEGLQAKYGEHRVFDTGIREATIMGQAIGLAMRGLRPIAEIQYLDYLLYALQLMSDDLATVRWRTKGAQKAPVIIRTRGHRLEGVWHSGSPMGMIIHACRGIHICVPRNMTKAAGFYNTLLKGDEPALVIEPLNAYRLKEKLPENLGEFCTPLGIPETISEGSDLTLVSYGSTLRIAQEACQWLSQYGISVELIDIQTLLPFDINHSIVNSLKKTNRLVIVDEDVPGGASAFILQQILEVQGGYQYLDSVPVTLTAKEHRPAYGSDGDYFSKPSSDDIFEKIYQLMNDSDPHRFPNLF